MEKELICARCGKTKSQRDKEPPMPTGIDHWIYCQTKSFSLYSDGKALCPECHKETELENLMDLLERR